MARIASSADVSAIHRTFSHRIVSKTALPTLLRYMPVRRPLVGHGVPCALLTFTIYPDLIRVWWHIWQKYWPSEWPVVIVDSFGELQPEDVPGARIQRFINKYHGWKVSQFIHRWVLSDYVWLTDDDKFPINGDAISVVRQEMDKNVGAFSFSPRTRWQININGRSHKPMGSYCVLLNRTIIEKERLPLGPVKGINKHKGPQGTYDTLDYANEVLLEKGYVVDIPGDADRYVTGFDGASNGRILATMLDREEIKEILLKPDTSAKYLRWWAGMAWGLYAVGCVAALHQTLLGMPPAIKPPLQLDEIEYITISSTMPDEDLRSLVLERFRQYKETMDTLSLKTSP